MRATLTDSRPSCREAVLDAIDRLQRRTGATEFVTKVVMCATRFVAGKAAQTSVDGLPLEAGVGGRDLGDDVAA